ncbi:hypothetical protein BZA05DRAFT_269810 [Tricharina praecox]|uniref:uncharacterized protein n=1 Tax=Tricharina praecox TaxID=43433 RepID=UPI0022203942|nr:uncharacterized protein BZA05DRAFT_269810 [Tricharina praecox]KAI5853777.1 hypothetical protein BZA05DRAFT_269810 [Tricharina praecox]
MTTTSFRDSCRIISRQAFGPELGAFRWMLSTLWQVVPAFKLLACLPACLLACLQTGRSAVLLCGAAGERCVSPSQTNCGSVDDTILSTVLITTVDTIDRMHCSILRVGRAPALHTHIHAHRTYRTYHTSPRDLRHFRIDGRQMIYALCSMLYALCFMLYASCFMLHASCYMLHALCYMLPLCSMLYATRRLRLGCGLWGMRWIPTYTPR